MGLKSMHEASRQSLPEPKQCNEQENSLLEQQSQRITELEHQISELSSINSTLMSELQKKSEIIVKLNEKEEIYNKSDLIKKQNAELEKQNRELEKARQRAEAEAMTEVETVKKEYAERERELARTQAEANKAKIDAEDTRSHQKELVNEKAQQMYNSRRKSLESAYQGKRIALDGVFFGSLAYGVLCTVFTAVRSERFVSDFKAFFGTIWTFLLTALEKLLQLAKWASQIGDKIPQEIVAFIVHWLILIAVVVLVGGGAVLLLFFGADWVYQNYKSDYADTTSLAVALASLAVIVFFAEPIRAVLPINLLLLLIITHVLYVGVRWYIKGYRQSRGYY